MADKVTKLGTGRYCFSISKTDGSKISGYIFINPDGSVIYSPMKVTTNISEETALLNVETAVKELYHYLYGEK